MSVLRAIFLILRGFLRSLALALENLALRQQLAVLLAEQTWSSRHGW